MPSYPAAAWERLGQLLVRRRLELDPRFRNRRIFTAERAVEYRIINDIELGRRDNYEPATLGVIELAYDLAPGTILHVLNGADLHPGPAGDHAVIPLPQQGRQQGDGVWEPPADQMPRQVSRELADRAKPHMRIIAARLADLTADGNLSPSGEDVFGDDPVMATAWDVVTGLGLPALEKAWLCAVQQAKLGGSAARNSGTA